MRGFELYGPRLHIGYFLTQLTKSTPYMLPSCRLESPKARGTRAISRPLEIHFSNNSSPLFMPRDAITRY